MGTLRMGALALLALTVGSSSISADEPLPLVRTKSEASLSMSSSSAATGFDRPLLAMDLVPLRDEFAQASLASSAATSPGRALADLRDAVAANDYRSFDAALARANALADSLAMSQSRAAFMRNLSVYRDIGKVWSYAENDRYGAFFDDESLPGFREHLAGSYRGATDFLAKNQLVDARGLVLYPSAETRAFLARQTDAPRSISTAPAVQSAQLAKPHRAHRVLQKTEAAPVPVAAKPVTRVATIATPKPALATPPPARVIETPHAAPAAAVAGTAKPVQLASAVAAPVIPVATKPLDALANDIHNAAPVAPAKAPVRAAAVDSTSGRGIFFIILALVVLGVLMTMLRTPEAQPMSIMPAPDAKPEPPAQSDVVPLKKVRQQ